MRPKTPSRRWPRIGSSARRASGAIGRGHSFDFAVDFTGMGARKIAVKPESLASRQGALHDALFEDGKGWSSAVRVAVSRPDVRGGVGGPSKKDAFPIKKDALPLRRNSKKRVSTQAQRKIRRFSTRQSLVFELWRSASQKTASARGRFDVLAHGSLFPAARFFIFIFL